jgi:hypothetical protein
MRPMTALLLLVVSLFLVGCASESETDAEAIMGLNGPLGGASELELPDGSVLSLEVRGSLADEPPFDALCDFNVSFDAVEFSPRGDGDTHMRIVLEPIEPDACG